MGLEGLFFGTFMDYIQLGIGWKDVYLGQHFDSIKDKLGCDSLPGIFEREGLEIGFDNQGYIYSIRFWNYNGENQSLYANNDFDSHEITSFIDFRTKEGVDKSSTEADIIRTYGKPRKKFSAKDPNGTLRYFCYTKFDFVFCDERLLNIGIFTIEPEIYKDVPDEIALQAEYWQNRFFN